MNTLLLLVLRTATNEGCFTEIEKHFDLEGFLGESCAENVLKGVLRNAVWSKPNHHLIPVILSKSRDPGALCLKIIRNEAVNFPLYDYAKNQIRAHMEILNFSSLRDHPDYPKTIALLQKHAPELIPAAKGTTA